MSAPHWSETLRAALLVGMAGPTLCGCAVVAAADAMGTLAVKAASTTAGAAVDATGAAVDVASTVTETAVDGVAAAGRVLAGSGASAAAKSTNP